MSDTYFGHPRLDTGGIVPCRYCEQPTKNTGTKLCEVCWRFESAAKDMMLRDPALPHRVLDALRAKVAR